MSFRAQSTDCFGLIRPMVDAHTLGISSAEQLLQDCGYRVVVARAEVCEACGDLAHPRNQRAIAEWLGAERVTVLAFSYRLDPEEGAARFGLLLRFAREKRLLSSLGGPIRALLFAGLPKACAMVRQRHPEVAAVFAGEETPGETLAMLGLRAGAIPRELAEGVAYDEDRLAFGRDLVRRADYLAIRPVERSDSAGFGTKADRVVARVDHGRSRLLPPLMRAHVGPYLSDRAAAVRQFLDWARQLAAAGHLDVLSIGTSQLSQSNFGADWGDKPNGGGVPLNSREEFAAVWQAARPMLVRTYAGTRNIPALARMYEETINIAWHALSLWWFCRIDGRGPYGVRENLEQHVEALRFIAASGKPFEANIPHHFAFRGADDVTYVLSAVLAAKLAKSLGVRHFILQNMLNTPKLTWGIQDLAKSRAMLRMTRELEDERFRVILQPRGGLDYFSPDLAKAKAQLAAVTALMDDIEPADPASPPLIHVVSYSEASHLADPAVVNESIQITRQALAEYRRLKAAGQVPDMARNADVIARTEELLTEARAMLGLIETHVPRTYTPEGLYKVFRKGFLPTPYLWECQEEFKNAWAWKTRVVHGAVKLVDETGKPLTTRERLERAEHLARAAD